MPNNGSRRGATNLGTPLMIVAFVVIGGFMWWLGQQAAAERAIQQAQEEEAAAEDTVTTVQTVPVGDIEVDASPYEGQEIRIAGTNVASLLGEQGFWLETPGGNPFLVSKGPAVQAEGVDVTPGSRVTAVGTIRAMSDSVLTAWVDGGSIAEGDRIVAEFATHYLEADDILVSGGAAQEDTTGGGGEGSGGSGN